MFRIIRGRLRSWLKYNEGPAFWPAIFTLLGAILGFSSCKPEAPVHIMCGVIGISALLGAFLGASPYLLYVLPIDLLVEGRMQRQIEKFIGSISEVRALLAKCPNNGLLISLVDDAEDELSSIPEKYDNIGRWLFYSDLAVHDGYGRLLVALRRLKESLDKDWLPDQHFLHLPYDEQRFRLLFADLSAIEEFPADFKCKR